MKFDLVYGPLISFPNVICNLISNLKKIIGNEYHQHIWPASIFLTEAICALQLDYMEYNIKEKIIFELSAGLALPSLTALALGSLECIVHEKDSCVGTYNQQLNNILDANKWIPRERIRCVYFDWGDFPSLLEFPDLMLVSDCFYHQKGKMVD